MLLWYCPFPLKNFFLAERNLPKGIRVSTENFAEYGSIMTIPLYAVGRILGNNLQKAVKPRNTRNTRKNQDIILKHIYTEKVNFIKSLTA